MDESLELLESVVQAVVDESSPETVMAALSPGVFPIIDGVAQFGVTIPHLHSNPWVSVRTVIPQMKAVMGLPNLDGVIVTIAQHFSYVKKDGSDVKERIGEIKDALKTGEQENLQQLVDGQVITFTAATKQHGIQTALVPISRDDAGEMRFKTEEIKYVGAAEETGYPDNHPIYDVQAWVVFGQKDN